VSSMACTAADASVTVALGIPLGTPLGVPLGMGLGVLLGTALGVPLGMGLGAPEGLGRRSADSEARSQAGRRCTTKDQSAASISFAHSCRQQRVSRASMASDIVRRPRLLVWLSPWAPALDSPLLPCCPWCTRH